MFGAGTRLACQNLGCHLRITLVLLHKLAFPEIFGPTKPLLLWESAIAGPCDKRWSCHVGAACAARCRPSSSSLPYLLVEVQRHTNIVSHITKTGQRSSFR